MRGCVCVVEDEAGIRDLLGALCASHALPVRVYDSAEAFWGECDPVDIRCLVLDIELPGMSGLDLLKKLKTAGVYLPVILMSGRADSEAVVEALKLGAVDFFAKPFDNHDLLRRIEDLIRRIDSR